MICGLGKRKGEIVSERAAGAKCAQALTLRHERAVARGATPRAQWVQVNRETVLQGEKMNRCGGVALAGCVSIAVALAGCASSPSGKPPLEVIPITAANLRGQASVYHEGWFIVSSTEKALAYAKEHSITSSASAMQQMGADIARQSAELRG